MSTVHPVKFKAGLGIGSYDVYLDGEQIGGVQRREKRYNLRRVVVDRFWVVTGADGFNAAATSDDRRHHYGTRTEAAQALAAYVVAQRAARRPEWDGFESERWATIKATFPGSARSCLEQADTELEDM